MTDFLDTARHVLNETWSEIRELASKGGVSDQIDDGELIQDIRACVNSDTKSYRYVLPTQLVSKLADKSVDCRCIQAQRGGAGAFDARTVAHKIVVPFDQANENVLGGSPEPYVNNPLRVAEFSATHRSAQKNTTDWDRLCRILDAVEQKQDKLFTKGVLRQVLAEIYRRLSSTSVVYPVPARISIDDSLSLMARFLSEPSGGERLLALSSAMFSVIGEKFGLYAKVRRAKITSADAATGLVADLECLGKRGEILLAVEVKDRELTINDLKNSLRKLREKKVTEAFFLAQKGIDMTDNERIKRLVTEQFTSGHNIYVVDLLALCRSILPLLGESGRCRYLELVGHHLDEYRADFSHRSAWSLLLSST